MTKKLNQLNDEYQQITASKELEERIQQIMKTQANIKQQRLWPKITAIAATALLASSLVLNLSPALIYAMAEIPGLKTVAHVLTFGRYTVQIGRASGRERVLRLV